MSTAPRPTATSATAPTMAPGLAGAGQRLCHLLRGRAMRVLLTVQAVAAVILVLRQSGWLQPAELAAYDALVLAWAGEQPSDRILLVTASEADIGRYGWPLPDGELAALLSRLTGWGARAIGVDIYRDRPVPPGDAELTKILQRYPHI